MSQLQFYIAGRIDRHSFTSVASLGPRVAFSVRKFFLTREAAKREVDRVAKLHEQLDVQHWCFGPVPFIGTLPESESRGKGWVHLYAVWSLNESQLVENFDPDELVSFHFVAPTYAEAQKLSEKLEHFGTIIVDSGKFFPAN